jgi:methionine aminopeptidase
MGMTRRRLRWIVNTQSNDDRHDKLWTAQFEHTTVVTDTGAEILTMS